MTRSVLIIDDEPGIRAMLRLALEDAGYQVFTAARAGDGLELFRRLRPDAVLTDLVMPGRGGCAALRIIREESPDTPIILITGLSDPETRAICPADPDVPVLRKPVPIETLEDLLRRTLAGRPARA